VAKVSLWRRFRSFRRVASTCSALPSRAPCVARSNAGVWMLNRTFVLALFLFCSPYERNITQRHDIQKHIEKWP
jgi:hypothetical protein